MEKRQGGQSSARRGAHGVRALPSKTDALRFTDDSPARHSPDFSKFCLEIEFRPGGGGKYAIPRTEEQGA